MSLLPDSFRVGAAGPSLGSAVPFPLSASFLTLACSPLTAG